MRWTWLGLLVVGSLLGTAVHCGNAHGQPVVEDDLPRDPLTRMAIFEQRLSRTRSDVENAETEKARVQSELEGLAAGQAAANRRLRDRTRALYRMTRTGVLPLAGGFHSLLAHVARIERLRQMVRRDASSVRDLHARAEALRAESARLEGAI